MTRKAVWPKSVRNLPFDIPWAKGVEDGPLIAICGMGGAPNAGPYDFSATLEQQTCDVLDAIDGILEELDSDRRSVSHLILFYKARPDGDEDSYRATIESLLPQGRDVVLTMVPTTHFAPEAMLVEVDTYAGKSGARIGEGPSFDRDVVSGGPRGQFRATRLGDLIYIGSIVPRAEDGALVGAGDLESQLSAVLSEMQKLLARLGASLEQLIKLNTYFVAGGDEAAVHARWHEIARCRARILGGRGPAITDIPVHHLHPKGALVSLSGWAVDPRLAGDISRIYGHEFDHWRWPYGLSIPAAVKAGRYVILSGEKPLDSAGGIVGLGDVKAQASFTMQNMGRLLSAMNLTFADVLRLNAHYRGPSGYDELYKNLEERARCWPPHPSMSPTVATGVPRDFLAFPGQLFEIEIIATTPS